MKLVIIYILTLIYLDTVNGQDILYQGIECNDSLWERVYRPERFQILSKCITVIGIVKEVRLEPDGDTHILLKLDEGQDSLLYPMNYEKQDGCLVLEIICINNIFQKSAIGICDGYINEIIQPSYGEHISVIGTYVFDTIHSWTEIHPVSRIFKILK